MRVAFIGDIVGRPGRSIIAQYLSKLKEEFSIDLVIANYENASHGFGLTEKNCKELLSCGIDVMSGGNHSFDKKEIMTLFEKYPLIRPLNYPESTAGNGLYVAQILQTKVAIINLMGHFTMPLADNPFTKILKTVEGLEAQGFKHIIIDMHAQATSEKNTLLALLKERVSAIIGTHTHIGTDDLQINAGCCYVTDVGLTGCRDGVIGMESTVPLQRFVEGIGGHFKVPEKCRSILQIILFDLDSFGRCVEAKKIRIFGDQERRLTQAIIES